jgi:hypothetical protein
VARHGDVSIQHITDPYVYVVKCCDKQGDPHSLSRHDADKSDGYWSLHSLSHSYKLGLMLKTLHDVIKGHLTMNVLMIQW